MRCSWVEKNRSRNIIVWERTKNDVRSVVSLFGGNLIHTSTSGGRCRLGGVDLRGRPATIVVVVVVGSGTWWILLDLTLILGTLTRVMARLDTLVASPKDSAGSCIVWLSWVELSRRMRRHIGWPRWVVLPEHTVGDPDPALLRDRTG